jgi:hypothetical protein
LPTTGPKRDACLPKIVGKDQQHVGKFDAHSAYGGASMVSVINQIEGPIITLRDGRNQVNIAADLW